MHILTDFKSYVPKLNNFGLIYQVKVNLENSVTESSISTSSVIPQFHFFSALYVNSFLQISTMTAILNVIPMKKRKQTKQRVTIFQNKNKNVINQEFKIGLHVMIYRAEGLDRFSKYHNVVYWIKPGEEFQTEVVEVQRFNSLVDPGTSSGKIVIGRVKIPIPKAFDRRKVGSFPLIRSDEKGHRLEGNILLSMTLQKIKPDSSPLQLFYR
ncbi:hypothetical protein P8452_26058 [Trifolium repens]|nr:hypothetical protein P8452_26058 [Trifolium repens]